MSALVGYASSDDEDDNKVESRDQLPGSKAADFGTNGSVSRSNGASTDLMDQTATSQVTAGNDTSEQPSLGPARGALVEPSIEAISRSMTPFSADRAAIRSLTLPQHPNLDIPTSPPGSPDLALEAKVSQFRDLKRRGVHFNAKLASAASLKNPGLFPKLMSSAGLVTAGSQYTTSLEIGQWDPQGLLSTVSVDELDQTQKDILKRKEAEKLGNERQFIKASNAAKEGASAES